MSSLKEIKGRIASVKSTLKITSAMKMVASAKLHKAQASIESMLPYEATLHSILDSLNGSATMASAPEAEGQKVAIVAISSNSSLCGGFNNNIIKALKARVDALVAEGRDVEILPVGRKVAEAVRKMGYECDKDFSGIIGSVEYEEAAEFAAGLIEAFETGKYSSVELVYNHFVSISTQRIINETFLPYTIKAEGSQKDDETGFIIEPSPQELLELLLPRVLRFKIFTVLMDSAASEHAARMLAMQTASDNADNILQELSLEYNKSRQQKITSEILDLVGGMQES